MGVGYDGQAAALCLSVSLSLRLCLSVSLSLGLSVACRCAATACTHAELACVCRAMHASRATLACAALTAPATDADRRRLVGELSRRRARACRRRAGTPPGSAACTCQSCAALRAAARGPAAASNGRFRPVSFARAGQLHPSERPRAAAAAGEPGFMFSHHLAHQHMSRSLRSWRSSTRTTRRCCDARRTRNAGREPAHRWRTSRASAARAAAKRALTLHTGFSR